MVTMTRHLVGGILAVLLLVTCFTGVAVAQDEDSDDSQAEATTILENVKEFLAQVVALLGVIAILIGAVLYGFSRKDASRAQWGMRLMFGGGLMIVVSAGIGIIRGLFESFVPGMLVF